MANRSFLPVTALSFVALLGWLRGLPQPGPAATRAAPVVDGRREQSRVAPVILQTPPVGLQAAAASGRGLGGEDESEDRRGCREIPENAAAGRARMPPPSWCEPVRRYEELVGVPRDLDRNYAAAIQALRARISPPGAGQEVADYQVQFMIALVPDPLDSQLPAAFDQTIDAIQQGFAYSNRTRRGYLPDRSWIPWADDQAIKDKSYRTAPGLLLFRRFGAQGDQPARQLMGVFLVGETPKTGIHQDAFRKALKLIGGLTGGAIPWPVKILGPTFSGSAASLRTALLNWHREHPDAQVARFEIVTGSARAPCLERTLRLTDPQEVTFYRAVVPLDVLLDTSLRELQRQMGWDLHRVLLITELDTAFGQSVDRQSIVAARTSDAKSATDRLVGPPRPDANVQGCEAQALPKSVLVARFPSHISAIRTARAAAGLDKPQADPTQIGSRPPSSDLQLSFADGQAGADRVPDFSPLTAPASEIAIAGLIEAIARDGVRYAGIVATDVRDTLFLAERIHSLAPNVTLFALEGDLLFVHPQVHAALNGMTLITSAPLFASEKSWGDEADDVPWQASSSFEAGIYHATVELLAKTDLGTIAHDDVGPVWISVVGDDALWPLSATWSRKSNAAAGSAGSAGSGSGADRETGDETGNAEEMVVSFEQLVEKENPPLPTPDLGSDAMAAAPAPPVKAGEPGGTGQRSDQPPPASATSESGAMAKEDLELLCFAGLLCAGAWWLRRAALLPAPASDAEAESGTRRLLAAGLTAQALAAAVLLALTALPHWGWLPGSPRPRDWRTWQVVAFLGLCAAYLLLVAVVVWALTVRRPADAQRHPLPASGTGHEPTLDVQPRRRRAAAGALLAGLAAPPVLAWLICDRWMICGIDFDRRVRAFASGLSPLVSLAWLVGALYLWTLLELKRRRLTAWQRIDWPLEDAFEPAFTGSSRLLGTIRWLLAGTGARTWWRWVVLAGLIALPLLLVWHPMQPAAEKREFGRVMLVLWTLPAALSAISCYRFVRVWRTLRKLMVRIASTALAGRLGSLSAELQWKPMQAFSWPIPPFETLILSLMRIKQMAQRGTIEVAPARLQDLDRFLGLAFEADTRGQVGEEIGSREELERLIREVGSQLALHRGDDRVEEFFALRVAAWLRYVFAQLRSSLMSAVGPAFLLLLAVAAYTFEPKGAVSLGPLALIGCEIVIAISVFVAMNRDTVLSLIAGNKPGEVTFDWHFVSSLITFGIVPLLGLIATQVPAAGQLLNGWLKPLLRLVGVG